ncbi:hypothetical protein PHLCEN_2v4211 [Hermanssonia centrifuga]|uniref:Uncharacterized protein n=1 Tax=Hermanssonia centrifuga TaxID=98765 RepID=A0A2R6PYY7_9APHY|nr:hypothetical protein PHLCEN_2v4211 [Hermanssonia centrifuga]
MGGNLDLIQDCDERGDNRERNNRANAQLVNALLSEKLLYCVSTSPGLTGLPGLPLTRFDFECDCRRRWGEASRHGERERERAGDDEREAKAKLRERKDERGDDGEDLGERYMAEKDEERSGEGIGIDKPGVRGVLAKAPAAGDDVANMEE